MTVDQLENMTTREQLLWLAAHLATEASSAVLQARDLNIEPVQQCVMSIKTCLEAAELASQLSGKSFEREAGGEE